MTVMSVIKWLRDVEDRAYSIYMEASRQEGISAGLAQFLKR